MIATVIPFPIREDHRPKLEPIESLRPAEMQECEPRDCTEKTTPFERGYAIREEYL